MALEFYSTMPYPYEVTINKRKPFIVNGVILKYGNKYYGWNSFKSMPYLTNKKNSEIFYNEVKAKNFLKKFNLIAEIVYNQGKIL